MNDNIEYVWTVARLKSVLANPERHITDARRADAEERIEAAEAVGRSTVILDRPLHEPGPEQGRLL
jgi:hypothetical protein